LQLSPTSNMPHKVKLAEGLVQPQRWSSGTQLLLCGPKDKLCKFNAIFAAISFPCSLLSQSC